MSAIGENVYYSPENTSDRSYVILPEKFIASLPRPGDLRGGLEVPVPSPVRPRAFTILIGALIGAAVLDILFNRGKLTLHKQLPGAVGGSAAMEAVKAGAGI